MMILIVNYGIKNKGDGDFKLFHATSIADAEQESLDRGQNKFVPFVKIEAKYELRKRK